MSFTAVFFIKSIIECDCSMSMFEYLWNLWAGVPNSYFITLKTPFIYFFIISPQMLMKAFLLAWNCIFLLLKVVATDADSPEFSTLLYSLSDGFDKQDPHPLFKIYPQTGELCVSQDIDRDSGQTVHDILIKAEDPVSGLHLWMINFDILHCSYKILSFSHFSNVREAWALKRTCTLR